jgi:ubiquinone/menaquinone biosynthesis C-methylase UbiE
MDHSDHVNLLRGGIPAPGGVWADFGSGSGAFTLALAELIGPAGEIFSIDQDRPALQAQKRAMQARFPDVRVHYLNQDFTKSLDLPLLDGIVMANSLHFHARKETILQQVRVYLKSGGRLVLVEYNTDRGNPWVPHPLSYPSWQSLAGRCGFVETRLLFRRPSRFLGEIYSTLSLKSQGFYR